MTTKLLIPMINHSVTLFKGPIWYLSPDIYIKTITPEDHGLIYDKIPEEYYKSFLSNKCKCITIDNIVPDQANKIALLEGSKISFLFNYFRQLHPIVIAFAVKISKNRKVKVENLIDLPVIADVRLQRGQNYRLRTGIDSGTISDFYKVITIAYNMNSNILLSLERFNSSLHRAQHFDKIIDISVCLESLIDGTAELKNRFSLYNAWIAEKDPKKRQECFDLLSALYDARSAIVHGLTMTQKEYHKKIDPVLSKWDDILKIAERALTYYLLYVFQKKGGNWYKHQQSLVIGTEKRIIE